MDTLSGRWSWYDAVPMVEPPPGDRESADALLERFGKVTVWRRKEERAPHKPLLLLMALARVQRGESRLMQYSEVEDKLVELLRNYGPARAVHHPNHPFWRLQNDAGLWEVPERAALLAQRKGKRAADNMPVSLLRLHHARGGLAPDIDARLRQDPELVHRIAAMLLDIHFPPTLHEDILDAVGMPWVPVGTSQKRRDPGFRRMILRIYEYRCAVCGYDGRLGHTTLNIEAAHVKWHAAGGPDKPDNGIAMCSFHHKAFDRGALGLDDDHRISVSQEVHGQSHVDQWLIDFTGQPLRAPQTGQPLPALEYIRWHRKLVFRAPARV